MASLAVQPGLGVSGHGLPAHLHRLYRSDDTARGPLPGLLAACRLHRQAVLRHPGHAHGVRFRGRPGQRGGAGRSTAFRYGALGGRPPWARSQAGVAPEIWRPRGSRPSHGAVDGQGRRRSPAILRPRRSSAAASHAPPETTVQPGVRIGSSGVRPIRCAASAGCAGAQQGDAQPGRARPRRTRRQCGGCLHGAQAQTRRAEGQGRPAGRRCLYDGGHGQRRDPCLEGGRCVAGVRPDLLEGCGRRPAAAYVAGFLGRATD